MVGQLNTASQVQQPKLDAALDYDVLIVGAGQVSCFQHVAIHELTKFDRVACIRYTECANLV